MPNSQLIKILPQALHEPWFINFGKPCCISINYFYSTKESLIGQLIEVIEQSSTYLKCQDIRKQINVCYGKELIDSELCELEGTFATENKTTLGLLFENPFGHGTFWIQVRKPDLETS